MKRWLAIILCLAFLHIGTALAQETGDHATKEDVQKMFDVMHSRKQFDAIMDVMKQQLPALTKGVMAKQLPNATPEETARLNEFVNAQTQRMFEGMPFDDLMQVMMPAYQHHFTHGEIQEVTRFYSSPVGQKLLTELPAVMGEYMQAAGPIMQKWMQGQMAELKTSAEQYAKTLRKEKSHTAAPSAKPTS
jgi:hypothetical protein